MHAFSVRGDGWRCGKPVLKNGDRFLEAENWDRKRNLQGSLIRALKIIS
jgi:hypothetical protein